VTINTHRFTHASSTFTGPIGGLLARDTSHKPPDVKKLPKVPRVHQFYHNSNSVQGGTTDLRVVEWGLPQGFEGADL